MSHVSLPLEGHQSVTHDLSGVRGAASGSAVQLPKLAFRRILMTNRPSGLGARPAGQPCSPPNPAVEAHSREQNAGTCM
jgi:hypothetical protein